MNANSAAIEFDKLLQKSFFFKSYGNAKLWNEESRFPEIAFLGRSNSGKSSLINSILGKKSLAKTSRTPGKTKLINVFAIPNLFSLVDLPGFGYSEASHKDHKIMMNLLESYLNGTKRIRHFFILLDCRRAIPEEELEFIKTCQSKGIQFTLLRTKSDKLNQSEKNKSLNQTKVLVESYLFVSTLTGMGIVELKEIIRRSIE